MNVNQIRVWEGFGDNESDEDRYVFYVMLPSLQEIAVNRVALAIWYSYISRTKFSEFNEDSSDYLRSGLGIEDEYLEECNKAIKSLKTPRSIEKQIETALESVYNETRLWIMNFKYDTFSHNLEKYRIQRLDANFCVWLPNGKIDYGKTGPKMLSTPGLSEVQKFAIMCEFCMENEIRKFSLRFLPELFIKQMNFNKSYIMYYWICYLKNDLDKLPLNDFNSIDMAMAARCDNKHWTAFEYFWNRLSVDDQVTVAVFRCDNRSGCFFHQPQLLSKMSWEQQSRVLLEIPDQIMLNFWIRFKLLESAIWTWNHSKDLITVEQFAKMVKEIFHREVSSEENMRMFMQIWDSASDQQKNYVIQTMEGEIISSFFLTCDHCPAAFEFLYKFLSAKSEDCRRRILMQNAAKFACNVDNPNSMDEVINLCLSNVEDQLSYKRLVMESQDMQNRGELWVIGSDLQNLKLKVQFYSADAGIAQGYVKRLLGSEEVKKVANKYLSDVDEWNKFSHFVDDIFSNDFVSGLNVKKAFITSYASNCLKDLDDENGLDEMIKVLSSVFTTDDELQAVKQMFLNSLREALVNECYRLRFADGCLHKLVLWCVGGNDGVDEFKRTISIDAIFDKYVGKFVEQYIGRYRGHHALWLLDLDRILRWYFMGDEGTNNYKLDKIRKFDKIAGFRIISEGKNDAILESLLEWIFNDDHESVRKFRAKWLEFRRKMKK